MAVVAYSIGIPVNFSFKYVHRFIRLCALFEPSTLCLQPGFSRSVIRGLRFPSLIVKKQKTLWNRLKNNSLQSIAFLLL